MSRLKKSVECRALVELIIHTTSTQQAVAVLKCVTSDQSLAIGEVILNVLQGNITLTPEDKKKFSRHKTLLRKLCSSSGRPQHKLVKGHAAILVRLLRIVCHKLVKILSQL